MKLSIRGVANAGELGKERLILDVVQDADLGDYVLMRTGFRNGNVTIGVRNALWFQYEDVSSGDVVVIYSKAGQANQNETETNTVYFYYWHQTECLWGADNSVPVLLDAPDWGFLAPDDLLLDPVPKGPARRQASNSGVR